MSNREIIESTNIVKKSILLVLTAWLLMAIGFIVGWTMATEFNAPRHAAGGHDA